jgi:hypothetical protein
MVGFPRTGSIATKGLSGNGKIVLGSDNRWFSELSKIACSAQTKSPRTNC